MCRQVHLLASWLLPVLLKQYGTSFVVFEHDVVHHMLSVTPYPLCLEEIVSPYHLWHHIVHCNQFCLSRALGIQLLLSQRTVCPTFAKWHHTTSMALHVLVDSKCSIDPPPDQLCTICLKCQQQTPGPSKILHCPCQLLVVINIRFLHPNAQENHTHLYDRPYPLAKEYQFCHIVVEHVGSRCVQFLWVVIVDVKQMVHGWSGSGSTHVF